MLMCSYVFIMTLSFHWRSLMKHLFRNQRRKG